MSEDAVPRLLRRLAARASDAELRQLFDEIRRQSDEALIACSRHAAAAKPRREDFTTAITEKLAPILAPAAEKAEMLVDELAPDSDGAPVPVRGLAGTIRRLVKLHGEEKVAAAAEAVMARARAWGSTRERVT